MIEAKADLILLQFADMNKVMEECADMMFMSVMQNFKVEGRPDKWKTLSADYVKTKQRKFGNKPILQASGAMMNAIQKASTGNTATVFVSNDAIPYAKYHQTGTKNMPARVFMLFQDADRRAIMNKLATRVITFSQSTRE